MKSNITDNESAKMVSSHGVIQGYNGIATVDEKHQVVIDAKAVGEGHEAQHVESVAKTGRALDPQQDLLDDTVVTVEPVFANIRNTMKLNRFTLRGQKKVDTQRKLYCLVHNIGKVSRYGPSSRGPQSTPQ